MSMLRVLPRAQAWNSTEYVCLCCRRRLLAQRQQQRGYSDDANASESVGDWAESFNNLGTEEGAKIDGESGGFRTHVAATLQKKREPGKDLIPSAKDDVFRKHGSCAPEKSSERPETRRQRMARKPQTMNFDSLKKTLENHIGERKGVPPQHEAGLSGSYQPFAPNPDSSINNAVAASPAPAPRKSTSKGAERGRLEAVDEYQPSPVAGPVPGGRIRDPKWEAILQEIKTEFTTIILPQLLADAAKKRRQDKPVGRSHESESTVEKPTRLAEEAVDSSGSNEEAPAYPGESDQGPRHMLKSVHKLNTATKNAEDEPTHNADPEPTKFQRMYDESMKLNYQDDTKPMDLQPAQEIRYGVHRPLRHLTKPATTSGMRSPIANPVTRLTHSSSVNTTDSTDDATPACLEQLAKPRPSYSMEALVADLEKDVKGSVETIPGQQDVSDTTASSPDVGTKSVEQVDRNSNRPLNIQKSASTSSLRLADIRRQHMQDAHYFADKRFFSSLARRNAPATNHLNSNTSLQSSSEPIPPWGLAGSDNDASTILNAQRSTSDVNQLTKADQEFLSLLPNVKGKNSPRARASRTPPRTKSEKRAEKRNLELAEKVKAAKNVKAAEKLKPVEKVKSAKKAKKSKAKVAEQTRQSQDDMRAALKTSPSEELEQKDSRASEKQSKGKKSSRIAVQEEERLLDSNTRDDQNQGEASGSTVKPGIFARVLGWLSKDQSKESSIGQKSAQPSTPTIRKHAVYDPAPGPEQKPQSDQTASERRGVRFQLGSHSNELGLSMRRRRPLRARVTKTASSKISDPRERALMAWQHRRAPKDRAVGRESSAKPIKITGETGDPAFSIRARMIKSDDTSKTKPSETPDTRTLDAVQSEVSRGQSPQGPAAIESIAAANLEITPLDIPQPAVPALQYGLDRALFNPGVFQLQDPHSRVYNFDPYLQKIMPVMEFDYNALKQYKTSSQDTALSDLAKEHGKRYIGSTSSMTGTLGHFHYLISAFRSLNIKMLSRSFPDSLDSFTQINRAPNAIFLRNKGDGIYAIDADKEFDGPNVLMMLGKSMEKLLTLPKSDYERYRKENSHEVSEEERTAPEAYEYTTMGSFLMRSQLDAYDSRLPGTGMFDLKTRAVVSVRMNTTDYEPMTGYEIQTLQGRFQSYEREYYDMMRSTMLKYMLQARMGRMDGIFLAYHNVERIFGFQYVPMHEMDRAIHSQTDRALGDQEFKLSLDLLNKVLDKATKKFPDTSLRLHFETSEEQIDAGKPTVMMWIFAEPISEHEIEDIQAGSRERMEEFERTMMGIERVEPDGEVKAKAVADAIDGVDDSATAASDSEATTASKEEDRYATTTSDAAPTFAPELVKARELKPLFSVSIVCKSRVNDSAVERPKSLKPDDKWELEYSLQEWETSETMWARYEDMKTRRKGILEKNLRQKEKGLEVEDGAEGGENGEEKKKDGYVDFLKSMSRVGRSYRERMDELDAGREVVVVGQPVYAPEEKAEEQIEGLEDYMGWLYRSKA